MKTYKVPFSPGNGKTYMIKIVGIYSDYPRDEDGVCPFCHGDPCAEQPGAFRTRIGRYMSEHYKKYHTYAPHCPMCLGRPS